MTHWMVQRQTRRTGRRWLVLLAAVVAVLLMMCMGFTPMLLRGMFSQDSGSGSFAGPGCGGLDLAAIPLVKGLSKEQVNNAATIIATGKQMNVPPRGWMVAIATAAQESTLHNYKVATDHDSLGLFQQRPSMGWGRPTQLTDPRYAAAKFYEKLVRVKNWNSMRVTEAAQQVQRSAFPNAYQKWEPLAAMLVSKLAGAALKAADWAPDCVGFGQISAAGWTLPTTGAVGSGFHTADRPNHDGVDMIAARHAPIRAAAGGIVITVICNASSGTCDRDGSPQVRGCGWYVEVAHGGGVWTRYCHMAQRPSVVVGQRVNAGDLLGYVGSSGNSSGPHLHFEVHHLRTAIDPVSFMAGHGAPLHQRG